MAEEIESALAKLHQPLGCRPPRRRLDQWNAAEAFEEGLMLRLDGETGRAGAAPVLPEQRGRDRVQRSDALKVPPQALVLAKVGELALDRWQSGAERLHAPIPIEDNPPGALGARHDFERGRDRLAHLLGRVYSIQDAASWPPGAAFVPVAATPTSCYPPHQFSDAPIPAKT